MVVMKSRLVRTTKKMSRVGIAFLRTKLDYPLSTNLLEVSDVRFYYNHSPPYKIARECEA